MRRPAWREVYRDSAHIWRGDEDDLVQVTRETARLALSSIHECQAQDAYHNRAAAADELMRVLREVHGGNEKGRTP